MENDILEIAPDNEVLEWRQTRRMFGILVWVLCIAAIVEVGLGTVLYLHWRDLSVIITFGVFLTAAIWQLQAAINLRRFIRTHSAEYFAEYSTKMGAVFVLLAAGLGVFFAVILYTKFS